jgi:hypothetical protein
MINMVACRRCQAGFVRVPGFPRSRPEQASHSAGMSQVKEQGRRVVSLGQGGMWLMEFCVVGVFGVGLGRDVTCGLPVAMTDRVRLTGGQLACVPRPLPG